jgi:hypothetical protein
MGDSILHMYPRTEALRRVLGTVADDPTLADLLFLEEWERAPTPQIGSTLRAHQIRRANPALAAEIRAELSRGRPLTAVEREALTAGPPRQRRPGGSC